MRPFNPDQENPFLSEVIIIKLKNAGEAETIDIPIPRSARNVTYGYVVLLNNAQVHRADFWYKAKSVEGTIDLISANIFNALPVAATVTQAALNTQSATHIRYQIQANAGAQTRFYFHLKFFAT